MRIRARRYPGRTISTVAACMWPKSRYFTAGPTNPRNASSVYHKMDQAEVLAYIVQNGPVSCFDVELCCHMERKPAMKLLVGLEGQHVIERCYFGGEKFRVVA